MTTRQTTRTILNEIEYSSGGFVGEGQRAMENKDLVQIVLDEKTG